MLNLFAFDTEKKDCQNITKILRFIIQPWNLNGDYSLRLLFYTNYTLGVSAEKSINSLAWIPSTQVFLTFH